MSLTGNQLLTGLSRYIGDFDFPAGLATTGAGSSTSLVDTKLARFADDYLIDWYIRITENVNGNQYLNSRISDFASSTGTATLLPALAGGATGSGTDYEVHRISPDEKFSALDEARIPAYPALGTLVYNDTLTGDGLQRTFDIPSAVRRGPIDVFVEVPVSAGHTWNFLPNPNGDSLTGYTATGTTAAVFAQTDADRTIPKHDGSCTSLTTAATQAATYNMLIASAENSLTAAQAADRKMTHARWVYCTEASKIRVGITDDSGTSYAAAYHGGAGWELLAVEDTIVGNNATTLTAVLDIASTANASTIYTGRGWWYFGDAERVVESWEPVPQSHIRRDNTTQQVTLTYAPPRGYQIRLVGRGLLSELGTTAATQATNTMEIDEAEAEILYAEATKVLFRRGILSAGVMGALAVPLQVNEQNLADLKRKWKQPSPGPRMTSMWG